MEKKWPKDNKYASFRDLCKPISEAIRFCYKLERHNEGKDCPWTGLPLIQSAGYGMSGEEALSAERLKYDLEEQGRDALHMIIGIALKAGMEQGRRILCDKIKMYIDMRSMGIDIERKAFDWLVDEITDSSGTKD